LKRIILLGQIAALLREPCQALPNDVQPHVFLLLDLLKNILGALIKVGRALLCGILLGST